MSKINLLEKFQLFTEQWSPKIIAQLNDYHIKIAKIKGDFSWHKHDETDEMFIVIEGLIRMDYQNEQITLKEGELIVVPKGKEHKPFAEDEAKIMLIEPIGTLNTGDKQDSFTKHDMDWI